MLLQGNGGFLSGFVGALWPAADGLGHGAVGHFANGSRADAGLRGIGNVSPLLVPGVSEGPVCFGPPRLGLSSRSTCAVVPVRLCSAGLKLR